MSPTLILIRHAEGEHNATKNWDLPDPPLTHHGILQCKELQDHLRLQSSLAADIGHVISSPMKRALQTTLMGLDWLIEKGVPVEVDARWQENSNQPCDTGSDLRTIAAEFPTLDFSQVDPTYPDKSMGTPYAFTRSANIARGQACLQRLYDRPEKVIAVVSHSGFLRTAISQRRYDYADYRVFTFARGRKGELKLVEDDTTQRKGGAMGRSEIGVKRIEKWDFPPENVEDMEA